MVGVLRRGKSEQDDNVVCGCYTRDPVRGVSSYRGLRTR